ncbi:hypothetical protein A0H81_01473 [Grifola frondosa]|uniref:Uncharacterized protein n=1 Tax=Grifola frondosa TaxID=5627 RepID=A0A1C7MPD5_GRIFR|nr:hypothetical protein A0H81_01473 [Grifola frondosa]
MRTRVVGDPPHGARLRLHLRHHTHALAVTRMQALCTGDRPVRDGQVHRGAAHLAWTAAALRGAAVGHKRGQRWMLPVEGEDIRLEKLHAAEEAWREHDMEKPIGAYEYSRAGLSHQPSPLPSLRDTQRRRSPAAAGGLGGSASISEHESRAAMSSYRQFDPTPSLGLMHVDTLVDTLVMLDAQASAA